MSYHNMDLTSLDFFVFLRLPKHKIISKFLNKATFEIKISYRHFFLVICSTMICEPKQRSIKSTKLQKAIFKTKITYKLFIL